MSVEKNVCDDCGGSLLDGTGYDGLCGSCVDIKEREDTEERLEAIEKAYRDTVAAFESHRKQDAEAIEQMGECRRPEQKQMRERLIERKQVARDKLDALMVFGLRAGLRETGEHRQSD